jgi:hypothetical protein
MRRKSRSVQILQHYVAVPAAYAAVGAGLVGAISLVTLLSGFRGRYQSTGPGLPFDEALAIATLLSASVFVVTFVVVSVWMWAERQRSGRIRRTPY